MNRNLQQRLPHIVSFLLFLLLASSAAYWAMQLFKPVPRMVAAPPQAAAPEPNLEAAAGLFGGRLAPAAVATNYQLKGVIDAGRARESVAILAAEGKPALAVRVGAELAPGVRVKEVHPRYVLLDDGGAIKRVELPDTAPPGSGISSPVAAQTMPVPQYTPPAVQAAPAQPVPAQPGTAQPAPAPGPQQFNPPGPESAAGNAPTPVPDPAAGSAPGGAAVTNPAAPAVPAPGSVNVNPPSGGATSVPPRVIYNNGQ